MSAEIDTLHLPFIAFLKTAGLPYVNARSDRESTIAEGHPDFTILHGGHCLCIEFKDKDTKTSAAQKRRHAELRAAGVSVHVLRDLQRAVDLVTAWRLMHPAPVAEEAAVPHRTNPISPQLVRFGQAIYHRAADGQLHRIRKVAPDDFLIPELRAA